MKRLLLALIVALVPVASAGTVIVRVIPATTTVAVGGLVELEFRAEASDPILGWGLDIVLDTAVLEITGNPEIDAQWIALAAPDGDGLAGLVFPEGLVGDVRLATLTVRALMPGLAAIATTVTPGDLTEGFPLDPSGFDSDVHFESVTIQIVPEPATASMLAAALVLARLFHRRAPVILF